MAGMLPGVEAARRRRFHHRNLNHGSEISSSPIGRGASRRSTFCLYAISSYVFHSNSSMRRSDIPVGKQPHRLCDDESSLCAAAREAKKRLDERLQPQRMSQSKRMGSIIAPRQRSSSSIALCGGGGHQSASLDNMPTAHETNKLKKKLWLLKLIRWKSWSWSWSEQEEECAVCLEQLRGGEETLIMQLPCGHRFHTKCLMPWLDANINAHCPYCRMEIPPA